MAPEITTTVQAVRTLPILPLQNSVLFPYLFMPLSVGKPASVLIPPEEMAERQAKVARLMTPTEGPVVVSMLDAVRKRKDGTLVHVSIAAAPIRDAAGVTSGIASIVRDETERVEAERRRTDLETRLHQSERLESLGRLAGGVAHDLNNILAIVTNYADFLTERLPAGDPGADDLAQIQRAAERGTTFTRQLLTFARRGAVQPTELRLDELLGELRSMLGRTLPESIAFELRVPPEVWSVVADRGQIEQVALNLVVNARDAMPGGGRLVVEAQNVEYDNESAAQHPELTPGRYLLLIVTDTGHGMPKEIADRAFDPFFTTKPKGQGTGLGLATVYGIVQQAGGREQKE